MSNELKFGLELTWQGSAASAGLAAFSKEWAEFKKLVGGSDAELKGFRDTVSKITADTVKFAETMKLGGAQTQQLNRDVIYLHQDITQLGNRMLESRESIRSFGTANAAAARELNRVGAETRAADRAIQNIEYHFHGASNAAAGMRREVGLLHGSMSDLQKLTLLAGGAGLGYGAFTLMRQSGRLDQSMTSIMQTGDASTGQRNALRPELFRLARQSGRSVEDVSDVMNYLVQTGLSWDQALAGTRATVPAMAVTKAPGGSLAQSLVTSSNLYGFDLAKPGVAGNVMDLMRAGGKAGAAEMENLSQVLPIFATDARRAGMSFKDSLAYIEVLSNITAQPHKLGTLAAATLRIWNQKAYTDQISAMTGVNFFDKSNHWRPKGDVITDIIKFAAAHGTDDRKMHDLLGLMFKGMDEEGVRGFSMLIQDPRKIKRMAEINKYMDQAPGMLGREEPEAINNAIDQSARLGTAMRQIADDFARPINRALANWIEYGMKPKSEGGIDLSNGELLGVGAAALLGGGALVRGGGALVRGGAKLFRRNPGLGGAASSALSTGAGIVEGKAIEKMFGVTPVFVVNMPGSGFPGGGPADLVTGAAGGAVATKAAKGVLGAWRLLSPLGAGEIAGMGMGAMGTAAGFVGAAGVAGYGAGSLIYKAIENTEFADHLGGAIATALARLGNSTAQDAIDRTLNPPQRHELKIQIDHDGRAKVKSVKSGSPAFDIDVYRGPMMVPQ